MLDIRNIIVVIIIWAFDTERYGTRGRYEAFVSWAFLPTDDDHFRKYIFFVPPQECAVNAGNKACTP
jgi:hypothetical protein